MDSPPVRSETRGRHGRLRLDRPRSSGRLTPAQVGCKCAPSGPGHGIARVGCRASGSERPLFKDGHRKPGKSATAEIHPQRHSSRGDRRSELGHEDQFQPPRASSCSRFGQAAFGRTHGKGRDAPIPAVRGTAMEPRSSTPTATYSSTLFGAKQDNAKATPRNRRIASDHGVQERFPAWRALDIVG